MATNSEFIFPCGLCCGLCAIYIACRDNNIKLKERLVNLYKGETPGKGTLPNSKTLLTEDIWRPAAYPMNNLCIVASVR
jgi:hypothetical protein